jgi:hypothetical protein
MYFLLSSLSRIFTAQPGDLQVDSRPRRKSFSFSKPTRAALGLPSLLFEVPGFVSDRKDAGAVKLVAVRCSTEAKIERGSSPHLHLA